jgi:hypothetical protein
MEEIKFTDEMRSKSIQMAKVISKSLFRDFPIKQTTDAFEMQLALTIVIGLMDDIMIDQSKGVISNDQIGSNFLNRKMLCQEMATQMENRLLTRINGQKESEEKQ